MKRGDDVRCEDRLGPDEPPYRSRREAQVGRLLDRYGIPFSYEQPTVVRDRGRNRIRRPNFTLLSYNGLIVEYAGMPARPEYMAGVRHKQRAYAANQMPALFVYPSSLRGRYRPKRLIYRIRSAARSPRVRLTYRR